MVRRATAPGASPLGPRAPRCSPRSAPSPRRRPPDDVTIDNLAFKSLDGDSFAIAHVEFTNTNLSKDEVVKLLTPDTPADDDRALAQKLKADKIAIPAIDILGKDGSKIHLDRPDRQPRRRRPDRGARSRLARGDGDRQRRRGLGQVRRAASRRPRRRAAAGRRRSRQRRADAEPPRRLDPQWARHRRAGPRGRARPDDPRRHRLDRGAQRIFRRRRSSRATPRSPASSSSPRRGRRRARASPASAIPRSSWR